jgi:hypothetical protein
MTDMALQQTEPIYPFRPMADSGIDKLTSLEYGINTLIINWFLLKENRIELDNCATHKKVLHRSKRCVRIHLTEHRLMQQESKSVRV